MKAVILAGGLGTRLSEETHLRPKPMVEIGGYPILWHIMKTYSHYGITDFIICCGYKGYAIKEYFSNYYLHGADVTIDLTNGDQKIHKKNTEDWNVTLVDTGVDSMTGGRLKRVKDYLDDDEDFCFTYGDGVGNIDIAKSIEFHRSQNKLATLTAVTPPGRFGALDIADGQVNRFMEKPKGDGSLINGGYFVLNKKVIDLIADDSTTWEAEPLEHLAKEGQLAAFTHSGFWQPMDTLRDKVKLEELWTAGEAQWKVW
ncbi:MAG: glucose-1-phosphate cytidylyltransferase [Phenylobacterium sp.]|jgi:glucose-1-phosphate cytidylyltransferase